MDELTWNMPNDLLDASVEVMRPAGRLGNEGLALWLGRVDGRRATVTHVVSLQGPGFLSAPQQLRLSWRTMARLTELTGDLDTYLVGQIHSHPKNFIDLSDVDKVYGIRCQDYLSVVCPDYAQRNVNHLRECGVHLFDDGNYRRLSVTEVCLRIEETRRLVTRIAMEAPL